MNQVKTGYGNFRTHGDYCFKGPGTTDENTVTLSVFITPWCVGEY